jgi:hypothetical protein
MPLSISQLADSKCQKLKVITLHPKQRLPASRVGLVSVPRVSLESVADFPTRQACEFLVRLL